MVATIVQKGKKEECPTCLGKQGVEKKGVGGEIIEEICDISKELESSKITDGQISTDITCPTCKGKGYVESNK